MDSVDGIVYVHGYSSEGFDAQLQSNEQVWRSRISHSLNVCEMFESLGLSMGFVFLGGVNTNAEGEFKSTAQRMEAFTKDEYSGRLGAFPYECIYDEVVDTEREVEMAAEHSGRVGADFAVSVSNYDHTPRISRLWSELLNNSNRDVTAFVSSSDDKYSNLESISDGSNPFILEGAVFEPIIKVLDEGIWTIDTSSYDDVAEDMRDVLDEYQEE